MEDGVSKRVVTDTGEIVESDPPRRLVIRWTHQQNPELKAEGESRCTMELSLDGAAVKLSITHTIERETSKLIAAHVPGAGSRSEHPSLDVVQIAAPPGCSTAHVYYFCEQGRLPHQRDILDRRSEFNAAARKSRAQRE